MAHGRRRVTRAARMVAAALALSMLGAAVLVGSPPRASADSEDAAAAKAARQIERVRQQADDAAQGFADAEAAAAQAGDGLTAIEAREAAVAHQNDELRRSVEQLAVLRYIQGGPDPSHFLMFGSSVADQLQADQYAAIAVRASGQDVDAYEANLEDLGRLQAAVEKARKRSQRTAKTLSARHHRLEQRLSDLQRAEVRRRHDAAVQRALAAQHRATLARMRAANLAAAAAAAKRGGARMGVLAQAGPYDGNVVGYGHDYGGPGFLCPVAGPSSFVDTWGAPRSGGRKHQGVDMISHRGTPAVAVVAGVTRISRNRLGGNALWLDGVDGNSYYYAHFDRYGKIGPVNAGDVVGYVGDTGDARGTPHLHFEVHPGRGAAVDPYPTARSHC